MTEPDGLRFRWREVWQTVTGSDGDPIFDELQIRYAEPHRAYHTLEHIGECLLYLDSTGHLLKRPIEVELAVWFHDAIYDPRRSDNEEQSALLAENQLQSAGVDRVVADRTAELIRLTTHERDDLIGDEAILCDVDLAILGAEPERFERYDAAIRKEYNWVPEAIYRIERCRVLERFLNRPHIYHNRFFSDRLEQRARENLTQAIANYRLSE
jgi:predicted metal-dependent HD superfamily phosphohydrolase